MRHATAVFAALLLATTLPSLVAADDLIPAQVLVRRFPQGVFCPLPISLDFVAPDAPVIVTFTAVEFLDDGSGNVTWTEQAIDNVSIVTSAQAAANTEGPPAGANYEFCYIPDPQPVPYLHFNHPGIDFELLDLFDTDPAARGWTLGTGGYFSSRTAPRDVDVAADTPSGGSLGLGDGTGPVVEGKTASSSVLVAGLAPGVQYNLGAWWFANFVRFPYEAPYLTITITSDTGTPVARRSWGAVKAARR